MLLLLVVVVVMFLKLCPGKGSKPKALEYMLTNVTGDCDSLLCTHDNLYGLRAANFGSD